MKTRMHNGSRLLSLLLAVVLVFTLTVPAFARCLSKFARTSPTSFSCPAT